MSFFEATKDPDATLDYQIDWSKWLTPGDPIDTSTWTVETGITKETDTNTDDTATVWLSGGTEGRKYRLVNEIVTDAGRKDDRTLIVTIVQK